MGPSFALRSSKRLAPRKKNKEEDLKFFRYIGFWSKDESRIESDLPHAQHKGDLFGRPESQRTKHNSQFTMHN